MTSFISYNQLLNFSENLLQKVGLDSEARAILSKVLIKADMRGVPSHGLAHLRRHIADIKHGLTRKISSIEVQRQLPALALLNAHHSVGAWASTQAMTMAINMAKQCGIGAVAVNNSSHHGASGYYAMMALKHNMIGLAFSNTAALVSPTFGIEARLGTNPLAMAAPAATLPPFVLDMASSVVTRGSIERCIGLNKSVPKTWALDSKGEPISNPLMFLDELLNFKGGLLPLGGEGTDNGGHKGFGLAVMIDVLCSLLSGGNFGTQVHDTRETAACVNHFFMAINIDALRPIVCFKQDMDIMLQTLLDTPSLQSSNPVVYAGYRSHFLEKDAMQKGVPLYDDVLADLNKLAAEWSIDPLTTGVSNV
jgi:LDH2 family malate/lactate/ureidoglycolate dehydrogenase